MRLIDATPENCKPYLYDHLDDDHMIAAQNAINEMPTVDAVLVVRCKDCKHRPTKPAGYDPIYADGFMLEFPDEECPCQCADSWYSKYPDDDWFCPKGERKGENE